MSLQDSTGQLEEIIGYCESLYEDVDLQCVQRWKAAQPGRRALGFMPVYVARELIYAGGVLPVGLMGGGDQVEIIKGDAYYQSYICHIPRSTIEMALSQRLDCLDGLLCPSVCDVIRNFSGMWKLLFPDRLCRYVDLPQNFNPSIGGAYYRREMDLLMADLEALTGRRPTDEGVNRSIELYDRNRTLVEQLYRLRSDQPWLVPTIESYLLLRAGNVVPVEEHNQLLEGYLELAPRRTFRVMDNIRVLLVGSFCEQPPLGLIRTLEKAGCYIVDDDFVLVSRWLTRGIGAGADPVQRVCNAYLNASTFHSSKYEGNQPKRDLLLQRVAQVKADGVVFCAPSFCDPALLDQPIYMSTLDNGGIAYTAFKYAENTGQFQNIREQLGTFSDSIKLWSVQAAKEMH
ncbi:MAG: benzoyl-CoA reductase subunit C [Acidobacteria bacterium]|nr:benzoyl-CoA reductase subunit C [Acidobacteriota bacterium]